MATKLEKALVLEWLSGFEVARQADHARLRQEPVDCQRSIRLALGLIQLIHARGGLSQADLHMREESVGQARERWVALKKACVCE